MDFSRKRKNRTKIIKTGNFVLKPILDATYTQIQNAVKTATTIQNDSEGKDYESVFRRLIIRVQAKI
jgi:hypothetical protein